MVDAYVEILLHMFYGANASAYLELERGMVAYFFDDVLVLGGLSLSTIKINDVKEFGALVLEVLSEFDRIELVGSFLVVVALVQANALTIYEIDGWDEKHRHEFFRY